MSSIKWTKDSYLLGIFGGGMLLLLFYFIVSQIRLGIVTYLNDPYLFGPPRSELIAVTLNMIVFRFLMIKFDKEKTGKGVLLITVLSTFAYIIIKYKLRS